MVWIADASAKRGSPEIGQIRSARPSKWRLVQPWRSSDLIRWHLRQLYARLKIPERRIWLSSISQLASWLIGHIYRLCKASSWCRTQSLVVLKFGSIGNIRDEEEEDQSLGVESSWGELWEKERDSDDLGSSKWKQFGWSLLLCAGLLCGCELFTRCTPRG